MSQIDWRKAPEGAEFWNPNSELFYRSADGGFQKFSETRGRWTLAAGERYEYQTLIAKPTEWSGEGLPPVGICELRLVSAGGDWHKADIKFASRNVVVWDWVGEPSINGLCTAYAHAVQCRPIRTPEQIAAEDLREIIESGLNGKKTLDEVVDEIIANGYRKFEIVEN